MKKNNGRSLVAALLGTLFVVLGLGACSPAAGTERFPTSFDDAAAKARGTTVRFYHWGGSDAINAWLDTVVAPALKAKYDVGLERVSMDASAFVNKLGVEKQGDDARGSIDLVWINGENFKKARQLDLLWGPITGFLPNMAFVDPEKSAWDFGFPTEGYESPWGQAQLVFEHDAARTQAPADLAQLTAWIKANPGRFTYPEPPDFTGSAFIRQVFLALNGGAGEFLKGFDEATYLAASQKLWAWLEETRPFLWREGRAYPKSVAELDQLFARGEVDFNVNYTQAHAQNKIIEGLYPGTVKTFVLAEGALSNIHFVAVAFNAPNPAGALVLADLLLSPELQLSKNEAQNWGDFSVLDPARLSPELREKFAALDLGSATLDIASLAAAALPEIPADYLVRLEKDWVEKVGRAP